MAQHCKCNLLLAAYVLFPATFVIAMLAMAYLTKEYIGINRINTEKLNFSLGYLYTGTAVQVLASFMGFILLLDKVGGKYSSALFCVIICCDLYLLSTSLVRSIAWMNLTPPEIATDMVYYSKLHYKNEKRIPDYVVAVEKHYNCCGISGYHDYEVIFQERRVPDHCCANFTKGCGYALLHGPEYYLVYKLHLIDKNYWTHTVPKLNRSGKAKSLPEPPVKPDTIDISCATPDCDKVKVNVFDESLWISLENILTLKTEEEDSVSDHGTLKERDQKTIGILGKQLADDLEKFSNTSKTRTTNGNISSLNYNDYCHFSNFNHKVTIINSKTNQTVETTKQIICLLTHFNISDVNTYYHSLVGWQGQILSKRCYEKYNGTVHTIAKNSIIISSVECGLSIVMIVVYTICFWDIAERKHYPIHPLPIWYERLPGEKNFASGLGHKANVHYPPILEPESLSYNQNDDIFSLNSKKSKIMQNLSRKSKLMQKLRETKIDIRKKAE